MEAIDDHRAADGKSGPGSIFFYLANAVSCPVVPRGADFVRLDAERSGLIAFGVSNSKLYRSFAT
jgi:hypothetical protein